MRERVLLVVMGVYGRLYRALCGEHPNMRPWHFQWLTERAVEDSIRDRLSTLHGRVLDVGCGDAPYRRWMPNADYVGADVEPGPHVDFQLVPGKPWPVADDAFDAALCTQVLEHVADLEETVAELKRVVRPGGRLIVTVPFAYNEHANPHDYRRLSRHEGQRLLGDVAEVTVETRGRVGTVLGTTLLNWIDASMTRTGVLICLRLATLPVWLLTSAVVNAGCSALDWLDRTEQFYAQVVIDARL